MKGRNIIVIGAGKVGRAVATILTSKGYNLVGVYSKSVSSALFLTKKYGGITTEEPEKITLQGDIVFITTPDSEIEKVVKAIAEKKGFKKGQLVIHMSGALTSKALGSASKLGATICSLHPLQSFADEAIAVINMPGSIFAIEGQKESLVRARELVQDFEGEAFIIEEASKPLYHAAAVVASNYLVALADTSLKMLKEVGIPPELGWKALSPLVRGTLKNIDSLGIDDALTGPVARGDENTIKKHIDQIKKHNDELVEIYSVLGKATLEIAKRKKNFSDEKLDRIRRILEGEE